MTECLFCKIIEKKIPSPFLYEDQHCIVIQDIHPQAPIHLLILPKKHIATVNDCDDTDTFLLGHLIQTAKHQAKQLGIDESGYRLVFNCNKDGGQEVYHVHLHLLGGRNLVLYPSKRF